MNMGSNGRIVPVSKLTGSASHTGKMKHFIQCLTGHKATVCEDLFHHFKECVKSKNNKKK